MFFLTLGVSVAYHMNQHFCCLSLRSRYFMIFSLSVVKLLSTFQSFHSSVSVKPARPVRPVEPARPVRPAEPGEPVEPVEPVEPWSQWSPWSFRRALLEDVTTYQERLASHLTKMLRRSRNVLPVCAQEHKRYYPTPPHPSSN